MKAKITKVSKEEKRHILQMTDKELNYVQKSLQNFLGRYFYNGGSFRVCRHAKRRFFQKNEEISLSKKEIKMVLLFGKLIEFKKITFKNNQTELRSVFRLDDKVVVYNLTGHEIVTFWKNDSDDNHPTLNISKYTLSRKQTSRCINDLLSF